MERCLLQKRIKIIKILFKIPSVSHRRIIFGNDAHFQLGGFVKKQNCRSWTRTQELLLTSLSILNVFDCLLDFFVRRSYWALLF